MAGVRAAAVWVAAVWVAAVRMEVQTAVRTAVWMEVQAGVPAASSGPDLGRAGSIGYSSDGWPGIKSGLQASLTPDFVPGRPPSELLE
ncbi:MAG TPA: hypothetical protein IAA04_03480 [Candidatus Lachnoclostridium pullistercoris]|uniref:Uncharacterized protein n=1 Tax=Candidatus Lachnoclostridium pullistercoris TaxID=2838632 RepID=A0A9D2T5B9_9FIRM|nr:hypothetical protein [Candidatus Lachnoclostridium pullistercoris]